MNKKVKKILVTTIILIIILFGIYLEVNYLEKNNNKQQNKEINKTIYLEKETITTTIKNFNDAIIKNGLKSSIDFQNYTVKNNAYYYIINEDINLYIKPIQYIGNPNEEITYDLGIYFPTNSINEGKTKIYLKILINSNNNDFNDEDIEKLINEAIIKSNENKSATSKGITVRYFDSKENNNYKEFVIRRHYK